ncbi:MAG: SUMF1/EgtB/PvdO family nonheme iron enzyme, partial [Nitrospinae bacterium]|nr:SUMF1/EgtB/PvdO family nonheme iron enzyme [Nitrospinota bacterium]
ETLDGTTVEMGNEALMPGAKRDQGPPQGPKKLSEEELSSLDEVIVPDDDLHDHKVEQKSSYSDGELEGAIGGGSGRVEKSLSRLIRIDEGPFIFGCNSSDIAFRPEKKTNIKTYNFGQFPVTNNYFMKFVESTGYQTEAEIEKKSWVFQGKIWNRVVEVNEDGFEEEKIVFEKGNLVEVEGANWKHPLGPLSSIERSMDHPVVHINLKEALDFLEWRSKLTGKEFRLPTEYEWEKAARGPDGLVYPWGNEWDPEKCNSIESKQNGLIDVDACEGESPFRIRDMSGNVWEWTLGTDIPPGKEETARLLSARERRDFPVLKGGCWMSSKENLVNYFKVRYHPSMRSNFIGFRCARFPTEDELNS